MELSQMRKGMLVECQQGVGRILAVDNEQHRVLIEDMRTHEQMIMDMSEISDNPQLHNDCEQYY